MKKNILIVGGTSGLGLELAKHYVSETHTVCITGRHDPQLDGARFIRLSMSADPGQLIQQIDAALTAFTPVNTLIYAAGFWQQGHIDTLSDDAILQMNHVGLLAPALLVQRLKRNTSTPLKVMLLTSSSQYTPRELEPLYCATKAGLAMLGACLVKDREIGKVLVVAPSGMKTAFWDGSSVDVSGMLDPYWVAQQIVELSSGAFKYKYAKILRDPPQVIIEEFLNNDLVSIF
jgi:short-subunit dehydrogenase